MSRNGTTQTGSRLESVYGKNDKGKTLSISADGTIVAIGSRHNDSYYYN